jgi:hypothetical protein
MINSCTRLLITLSEVDELSSILMTRIRSGLFNVIMVPLMWAASSRIISTVHTSGYVKLLDQTACNLKAVLILAQIRSITALELTTIFCPRPVLGVRTR